MNKTLIFLLSIILLIFTSSISFSENITSYKIVGNKRILDETIVEYANFIKNKDYDSDELNNMQKKIFETGFFENIKLYVKNSILIIEVVENPIINFYNIQGEIDTDNLNKLYDIVRLGPSKIYSEAFFKKDLEVIKDFYLQRGYLDVEVSDRVVKIESDKVNILLSINKKEKTEINRIYFLGKKIFSNSELLDVVSSSEHGWWKFLSSNTLVNYDRIEYDKKLLKDFYLDNGYYDVQITSSEINKINNRANIVFSINSGDLFSFGSFKIASGENLINDSTKKYIEESKNKLLTKKYANKNIKKFIDNINNFFSKNKIDFILARINQIKNNNNIDIDLNIVQINKAYINNILIQGNSITKEDVIRRNIKFSEGDSYSEYKRNKSLDNLLALNIFKNAEITTSNLTNDGKIDININVADKPTGTLSAGAGYGASVGALASFGIHEKNFLGEGISINSDLKIGTQLIEGSVSIAVPDFKYTDRTLVTKLYSTKTTLSNTLYESKNTGFDVGTRYEILDNIYFKPSFGLAFDKVDVISSASSYLKSQEGNYLTNKISYNLEGDFRDNKSFTKDGILIGLAQEYGVFGSDIPYVKSNFYGSNFYEITEKQILNLKYGYSNITSLNNKDIKLSDRLFVPYQYAKGFEPRGFGPRDSSSSEFIGGNNSLYGTLSATVPNPFQEKWNINTITFLNAVNLWGTESSNTIDSNAIRSAIGIGIDWRSPLGPMNISFAKPITKESTDKTKTFSIDIGTVF